MSGAGPGPTGPRAASESRGGALHDVLANRGLRRIELAWSLGIAGDAAFTVAILLAAFDYGGAVAVGVLSIVRMAPSIIGAPLAGMIAGRRAPTRLLFAFHGLRALGAIIATLVIAGDGSPWLGLAGATLAAFAGAFVRPLQAAAMPMFAVTPDQLVAANSVSGTGEGLGAFLGPLAGGLLVAQGGAVAAAAGGTLLFGGATLALLGLRPSADEAAHLRSGSAGRQPISVGVVVSELTAGLRVLRRRPGAAAVMTGLGGQVFVRGLMTTLLVVASIELLGMGEPGVGILVAAYGLGTLAGAVLSVRLAGRRELAPSFAVSLSAWGFPLAVIALVPTPAVAIGALVVTGIANGFLDVCGFTLLQRSVPGTERMAVFGLLEAIVGAGLGIGGAVAPILISGLGVRGALGVAGAILPILAVAMWARLASVDREVVLPDRELGLLRRIPLFARLSLAALECLAEGMAPRPVAAGDVLMREGEPGHEYDVIAEGRYEVTTASRVVSTVGPGDGVGEIALLRSTPRTATVVALTDGLVYALDAPAFLTAVAGPTSAAAAAAVVEERLARSSPI